MDTLVRGMRCPTCRGTLEQGSLSCASGHVVRRQEGVTILLEPSFAGKLEHFDAALHHARAQENRARLRPADYAMLPGGEAVAGLAEWRLRRYDLILVLRLLEGHSGRRILDVGAWNGWLSHQLAVRGHDVTAVDYFRDRYDGLGATLFYPSQWRAIQMDLLDLTLLGECFDVVIVNRCLQFFPDPLAWLEQARQVVARKGTMILTGLQFFRDPRRKEAQVLSLRHHYQRKYGMELFLRPTRGWLDGKDEMALQEQGVTLQPYPQLWRTEIRARFDSGTPRHRLGVQMIEPY